MRLIELGRRDYKETWELMKSIVSERIKNNSEDTLIVVEHDHVITLGMKTTSQNVRNYPIPYYFVERGGDATYHGPGQIVFYPIMLLVDRDVRRFVTMLEETIIKSMSDFGIEAERNPSHRGVWHKGKKLASIGVAVSSWVTYHGFALNVNTDLSYFNLIMPCGLEPSKITSMKEIAGREFSMDEVKDSLLKSFASVFSVSFNKY